MDRCIAYKYGDISLVPEYSRLISRSDAKTEVRLGKKRLKLPIMPANMKSVINEDIAEWMSNNRYMYIMHRFDIDTYKFVLNANKNDWNIISISIGVQPADYDLILKIADNKLDVDFITIDIAHGHHVFIKNTISFIKEKLPNVFVIAGNVATKQAVKDLHDWGADCAKVGIGQGHVCTTKDKTGYTYPMFTCTRECSTGDIPIIADGGVRCNGDIAKAIAAGGHMVMAGSLFSACLDSPGENVTLAGGKIGKKYFGSASEKNKGNKRHIEGVEKIIESNYMTYAEKLDEIKEDLQSSVSYAGGNNLSAIRKSNWIVNY